MKLTKNQIRFNKELKRIERIAKELGIDTTLVLPKRITESRLKQIGKINRKNISRHVKNSSPLLTAKSSVDRTNTFLAKLKSKSKSKSTAKKKSKETTQTTTPKSTKKTATKQKQTSTPTPTPTPDDGFVPSPNPFTEPEPPITPSPTPSPEPSPTPNIPYEGHIEMPTPYEEIEIGQLSHNGLFQYTELGWYNIETGEKVSYYDDLYYKWQIAKEDFIGAISRDSHGAEILTRIIGDFVSTYGEQTIFDAMTHLDREFWVAIDTISRYRDADNGDMIINNYDTSVNIELVQHELKSYLERN